MNKHDLLGHLARTGEVNAKEVVRAFGVRFSVAAMNLLRLVRQGLGSRCRDAERGIYRYRLSERGQSRLAYLQKRSSGGRDRPGNRPSEWHQRVRP